MSWIAQGFTNVVNAISSLIDYLNPFSENFILKLVIEGIFTVVDFLNPLSENFILKHFINLLQDFFVFMFVPSQDSYNQIVNVFKEKFAFIDSIKIAIDSIKNIIFNNVVPSGFLKYSVDTDIYQGDIVIGFDWFSKFKPYTDLLLTGFCYLNFIWRLYRRIPSILNGVVI